MEIVSLIQSVLANPVFEMIASVALPVILIPILMRFVVSNIIIAYSNKKHMASLTDSMKSGYASEKDLTAILEVIGFAKSRLRRFRAFRTNLLEDGKSLLMRIKNVYDEKSDREKLTFPFSVTRLTDCLLLAFTDLASEYSGALWFRLIRNTRIVWFVRFGRIRFYWDLVFRLPVFEHMRSLRVLFRLIRLLLIPFIGLPFLFWYICRSVFTSVFLEGAFRFFYSILIMKAGYYAIHVFGKTNPVIEARLAGMRGKRIESAYENVEKLLDPATWDKWSNKLPNAADKYMELLAKLGIAQDRSFLSETASVMKRIGELAKRVAGSVKRAYSKKNPFKKESKSIPLELLELVDGISSVYRPGVENPLLYLRIKEVLAGAYFASLLVFYRIRKTPLLSGLLDKVSVEFVVSVSSFFRKTSVQKGAKGAKKAYDSYRIASIGYRAYQVLRGIAGPVSFAITAASPVVIQQIQDLFKEYIFHRCGRLAILVWESDLAKRNLLDENVIAAE